MARTKILAKNYRRPTIYMLGVHALRASQAIRFLAVGLLLLIVTASAWGQNAATLAFVDVNVIPMDTERVLSRHTVLVQGDRIVSIEPSDSAIIPKGAQQISAKGQYLIPGLIDVHSNLLSDKYIADEYADEELAVIVANGVLTIRDPIGKPELLVYRDQIENGELFGPSLYVGSPQLAGVGYGSAANSRMVATPFEAAAAVREFEAAGYDFIKLTFGITADIYEGIVLTARGRLPVIGDVGPDIGLGRALESAQQIEHLDQYLEALMDEATSRAKGLSGVGVWVVENWAEIEKLDIRRIETVVRATVESEIWNTPTLAFLDASFGTGRSDEEIEASSDYGFVSPSVREELLRDRDRFWSNPPEESFRTRYVELRNRIVAGLYRAGGKLMAGSYSPEGLFLPGFALHRELESLVSAGLPPFAALWAATRSPATFLSWGGGGRTEYARVDSEGIRFETATTVDIDFGRIAVGKRADLVLLGANPLDDIRNTTLIEGVVLRGRWVQRDELDAILERSAEVLSGAPLLPGLQEQERR